MSKPFQLLKTFSTKELNDFQKLLDSGYLGSNEKLSKLLKILIKKVRVFKTFTPALRQTIIQGVYNKIVLDEDGGKKLSKLMNE